jgi:hypothetical protein
MVSYLSTARPHYNANFRNTVSYLSTGRPHYNAATEITIVTPQRCNGDYCCNAAMLKDPYNGASYLCKRCSVPSVVRAQRGLAFCWWINGRKTNPATRLVRVQRSIRGSGFLVINIHAIMCAAHLIPNTLLLNTDEQRSWVINSHIDLEMWNKIYDYNVNDLDSEEFP